MHRAFAVGTARHSRFGGCGPSGAHHGVPAEQDQAEDACQSAMKEGHRILRMLDGDHLVNPAALSD
jgi:hypothetical protein